VAQRLHDCDLARPDLLVLSGALPPHLPRDLPALSTLPNDVFLRRLDRKYGGIPIELHQNRELAALVVPAYRADLAILERYTDPGLPPLDCPILVLSGDQDEFRADQLGEWARHTTAACQVRLLPGGHFYFRERPEPLLALLHEQLVPKKITSGSGPDSPRC
jgi:surfactin synthase thioesterase subunit